MQTMKIDKSGMPFGGSMGGFPGMGGMPPMMDNIPPVEENVDVDSSDIIDGECVEIPEEPDCENMEDTTDKMLAPAPAEEVVASRMIADFSILGLSVNTKEQHYIVNLKLLCRDINGKLFILNRNYGVETIEELENIKNLPINIDEMYSANKMAYKMLVYNSDSYTTELDYKESEDFESATAPMITFTGYNHKTMMDEKIVIAADKFACLAFIDSYIIESIENEHDFMLACKDASDGINTPASFFMVDNIEIITMVEATKKKLFKSKGSKTSIALIIKVTGTDKTVNYILTPFEIGKSFSKSKYRGKTIETIEKDYYADSDQYVSTLLFNARLHGMDKEFMMMRSLNKDKDKKIFLFNKEMRDKLQSAIEEY